MTEPDHQIEIKATTDNEMTDEEMMELFDLYFPPIPSSQQSQVPLTKDSTPLHGNVEVYPTYALGSRQIHVHSFLSFRCPAIYLLLTQDHLRE